MAKKDKDQKEQKIDQEEIHADWEGKYIRALADYQNLVKRTEEERYRLMDFANEILIQKLLPVIDDMEESVKHIKNEGLQKVLDKLLKILEDAGLQVISPKEGEDFNSDCHEALDTIKGKNGKIMKVHRKGYNLNSKVIRPALVAVGKEN